VATGELTPADAGEISKLVETRLKAFENVRDTKLPWKSLSFRVSRRLADLRSTASCA
jgi:hypothetical protein